MGSNVFVGVKLPSSANSEPDEQRHATDIARAGRLPNNYDYVLLPITNARYKENVRNQFQGFQRQGRSTDNSILKIKEPQLQELCIPPFNTSRKGDVPAYIGLLSSWLELESADSSMRELCYQVLLNECKYARFVGIDKLIVAPPRKLSELQRYSQVISRLLNNETISAYPPLILSVSLPLYEDSDPLATWELWHTVRKLCDYHPSLTISLAVPRIKTPSHVLNRWLSEPVSCLLFSSSIFATNQYNYPVLHKFNQNLVAKFQSVNGNSLPNANGELCIIIHGMEKYVDQIKGGEGSYLEYINFLLKRGDQDIFSGQHNPDRLMTPDDQITRQTDKNHNPNDRNTDNPTDNDSLINAQPDFYTPRLMKPLKPHSETLSNYVYSVFEKDVAKYNVYQAAIEQALMKLLSDHMPQPLTILIAGAGRGPLVDRTMHLLDQFKVLDHVKVIALEKNPQACLYLQKRNFDLWSNRVEIIMEDMRKWKDESVKVDLCISELLGSFGCNELSPECLFAIEEIHSKPNTIFIPKSYSSYIAPIASPLLHQKLRGSQTDQESPWVMHNLPYCILSSKINEIWSFRHPLDKNKHGGDFFSRNATTEFKIKYRGEIHGFIGFFTAELYNDITLSTVPDESIVKVSKIREHFGDTSLSMDGRTSSSKEHSGLEPNLSKKFRKLSHTPNMHSWSPLVLPLIQPFMVSDDTELAVFISRNHSQSDGSIWYEWSAESYVYLVASNPSMQKQSATTSRPTAKPKGHSPRNSHSASTRSSKLSKRNDDVAFDNPALENAFSPHQENVWQSVSDIHGLGNAVHTSTGPMFNLEYVDREEAEEQEEEEQELHLRVKTGVSALHNVNGKSFSIAL